VLTELSVTNFSLIKDVRLEFGAGLNVLTGESGAGKTLLIDALSFVLGKRPNRTVIGSDADECSVRAVFTLAKATAAQHKLPETVVLERSYTADGRSSLLLNGSPARVGEVRESVAPLVDISSQFAVQEIFRPAFQRRILDAFGDSSFRKKLEAYRSGFEEWRLLKSDLEQRRKLLQRSEEEQAYLQYLVEELQKAAIAPGEKSKLEEELFILENAEELARRIATAAALLDQGDDESPSAFDLLARAEAELNGLPGAAREHSRISEVLSRLTALLDGLVEARTLLTELVEIPEVSPEAVEKLRRRLDEVNRLEHKYKVKADELPAFLDRSRGKLDKLQTSPELIQQLESEVNQRAARLLEQARELHMSRQAIGRKLEKSVRNYLDELGFSRTEFIVEVTAADAPSADDLKEYGYSRVEFIISLNPGEPARALSDIASGGEASRLLLAVKAALQERLSYVTILFDEIEAGVGGDAAFNVARVLRDLAVSHQVIAVTHLAPVAAAGALHLDVVKRTSGGRTEVQVMRLAGDGRVRAIARMLGDADDERGRALAEEFLRRQS
jgi:DNA repair protein RecN (Recombination protein N)